MCVCARVCVMCVDACVYGCVCGCACFKRVVADLLNVLLYVPHDTCRLHALGDLASRCVCMRVCDAICVCCRTLCVCVRVRENVQAPVILCADVACYSLCVLVCISRMIPTTQKITEKTICN